MNYNLLTSCQKLLRLSSVFQFLLSLFVFWTLFATWNCTTICWLNACSYLPEMQFIFATCYGISSLQPMSDSQLQFITWGCLASLSDKIVLCGCNKNAELQWKVLDCRGGWSDRLSFLLTSTTFWLWTTTSPPFQLCTTTPSVQL